MFVLAAPCWKGEVTAPPPPQLWTAGVFLWQRHLQAWHAHCSHVLALLSVFQLRTRCPVLAWRSGDLSVPL